MIIWFEASFLFLSSKISPETGINRRSRNEVKKSIDFRRPTLDMILLLSNWILGNKKHLWGSQFWWNNDSTHPYQFFLRIWKAESVQLNRWKWLMHLPQKFHISIDVNWKVGSIFYFFLELSASATRQKKGAGFSNSLSKASFHPKQCSIALKRRD